MRWTLRWQRPRSPADDAAAESLHRIGTRLAALLVGLLCALLCALLAVVYFRTRADSLASLRNVLSTQARSELHHFTDRVYAGHQGHPLQESTQEEQGRGEIFIVFADQHLTVLGGRAGPFGNVLADRAAAAAALQARTSRYSTRSLPGDLHYLIYSLPAIRNGQVLGVVQTGISTRSYEQSLEALLGSLLLVSALGLFAAGGITWLVVHRALLPIRAALAHQRDFVADAAHELRAPLAILRTATELWLDPGSEEDQQEAVEQVMVQGSQLARLVDDLLLLARADSGAVGIEHEALDLAMLVRDTVAGMELVAEEQDVRVHLEIEPVQVRGDAGRLRQLLLILLDNALKHTAPGGTIAVRAGRQGSHALLQVRDWGQGIDPQDLPHLFDRFFRADRARSSEGTGLGLAIGRWIATAHGGQIRAENAPDHGAVFTVSLPLAA